MVSKAGRVASWVLCAAVAMTAGQTRAQSNLDAGKSPAQIFSDTCNACHRSPRELKPSSAGFLREHYTTGGREAAAMAGYLASVGSDPRAVQQRKPPVLGAGKEAPASETASKPAQAPQPAQTVPPGLQPPQTVPPGVAEQAKPPEKPPETQAALPATPQGRRPPVEQAKPSLGPAPAAAAKPRRPSESLEAGRLATSNGGAEAFSTQAAAAPSARPAAVEEFEE